MRITTKQLSRAATVAALYAALCFFLKPISYGAIQLRVSEALCVLPIFIPEATWGLFVGCIIANLLGGSSVAIIDMLLGSLTTLAAAFLTRRIYTATKSFFLSLLPPVLLNAVIVGSYVPFIYSSPQSEATPAIVLFSIITVGVSQSIVVYLLGVPFGKALLKTNFFKF